MPKLMLERDRTCYECKNHNLCFIRRWYDPLGYCVPQAIIGFLNNDTRNQEIPGHWQDILVALAHSCNEFEGREQ